MHYLLQFLRDVSIAKALLFLLALTPEVNADTLYHLDARYSGKIVRASQDQVFLQVGCNSKQLIALDKASILHAEFGPECEYLVAILQPESSPTCSTPVRGFDAVIAGLPTRTFIRDFEFSSPAKILLRYHDESILIVSQEKLKSLYAQARCGLDAEALHTPGSFAPGLCYEPRSWAVAFTGAPVSRNQIFTQGFSIYVTESEQRTGSMPDVREAFGHALTIWTAALQRIRDELEPELKDFIDRSVSRSSTGEFMLLTPPQAIRKFCKETATFEVQWVTSRGLAFSEKDQQTLAKAQFQGRTVFINAIDYTYNLNLTAVQSDDGTHSLVSIMAHELGHAFGLGHNSVSTESVMRPSAGTMSRDPSDDDARQLARTLLQDIKGRAPGEVSFLGCEGLSAR